MVKTFTDRYPLVGPAVWISSLQYYLVQIIVASAFMPHYSWRFNVISDLGNTACGNYAGQFICSPRHGLMNASFILLGVTMVTGSVLIYQEFKESFGSLLGFSAMTLAGVGAILVGSFPENTVRQLHTTGAELIFIVGNLGVITFSLVLTLPKVLRIYTFLSGIIALIATLLYTTHHYLGLGIGAMERVVAYPQTMWLIIFGMYISSNHMRKRSKKVGRL
jgi:hypothetical membrane protein